MKSALVLGATGFVGGYLVNELLVSKKYDRITTLIRTDSLEPHPVLEQIVFDFQDYSGLDDLLPVRDIFCCLGTTIQTAGSKKAFRFVDFELPLRFAQWAEKTGAESYSIVTAMGANPSSRIFYNQVKGNIEEEVKKTKHPNSTDFSAIFDLRPQERISNWRSNRKRIHENHETFYDRIFKEISRNSRPHHSEGNGLSSGKQ